MYDFITIALPYINGPIHIGHIYEIYYAVYIKNILINYKNLYIYSGIDCNGLTKKYNIKNIQKINNIKLKYYNLFINYNKTITFINKRICNWVFTTLCDLNYIIGKLNKKFYNLKNKFFIPDKYIINICNICNSEVFNYCDKCNLPSRKLLIKSSTKFIVYKISINIYFKNLIFEDWDFSRIGKYNGFIIVSKKKTFFYVWYDALISYISNNIKIFKKKNIILQFFGKDVFFFHIIFNLILKIIKKFFTLLNPHGFIKIFNNKISKSNNNNYNNNNNIKKINKNYLKFFLIMNIKKSINDVNLNLKIKNFYKIYFFNKILNLFFRIRKIFDKFDNKCSENFIIKKKHPFIFCLLKVNNIFLLFNKFINFCDKINKIINLNEVWKKQKTIFIQIFYTNLIKKIINIINLFSNIFGWGYIYIYHNFIIFNLLKYEN